MNLELGLGVDSPGPERRQKGGTGNEDRNEINDGMRHFLKYLAVALCSAIVTYLTASCMVGLVKPGCPYRVCQSHLILHAQNQKT